MFNDTGALSSARTAQSMRRSAGSSAGSSNNRNGAGDDSAGQISEVPEEGVATSPTTPHRSGSLSSSSSKNSAVSEQRNKGMILPFRPLALSFRDVNYFVDMPAVTYPLCLLISDTLDALPPLFPSISNYSLCVLRNVLVGWMPGKES